MELTLEQVENAIYELESKINNQKNIVNERDVTHLDNLEQLYISLLMKEGRG